MFLGLGFFSVFRESSVICMCENCCGLPAAELWSVWWAPLGMAPLRPTPASLPTILSTETVG